MNLAILIFVKYPEPGKVKTRIAVTAGSERAAEIYRAMVTLVLAALPDACELIVCFDPAERREEIVAWLSPLVPGRARFVAQAAGDLGARLEDAFVHAFAAGHERVAVIGSDCLEITPAIFAEARAALDAHDCAIGPAEDGGYYLLALKKPCSALFRDIAWSTDAVLAQTLACASAAGLSVHLLPTLRDVDTEQDWENFEC